MLWKRKRKKENEMALKWAEMRMIRWTCCVKVTDRLLCSKLRDRLGTDDVVTVIQQNRLSWYKKTGMMG